MSADHSNPSQLTNATAKITTKATTMASAEANDHDESPFKGNMGVKRVYYAFFNSWSGLGSAIRHESAFRQELTLALLLIPAALWLPVTPVERVLLIGSVLLVLIVELLNSSVEAAIDRISLERHRLSKRAKDLGSAAVLLALLLCVFTWVGLAGPHVLTTLQRLFS